MKGYRTRNKGGMKFKSFVNIDGNELEKEMNEFISSSPAKRLLNVNYSTMMDTNDDEYVYAALLLYELEGGA